jgi:hypothetical protein
MRKSLFLMAVLALAPLGAGPAVAQTQAGQQSMVGWGCSVASTAAVAAAVAINAQSLSSVVSGAVVVPLNPAVLYGGLTAIMVSSVCALGYHVVPVFTSPAPAPAPGAPLTASGRIAQVPP